MGRDCQKDHPEGTREGDDGEDGWGKIKNRGRYVLLLMISWAIRQGKASRGSGEVPGVWFGHIAYTTLLLVHHWTLNSMLVSPWSFRDICTDPRLAPTRYSPLIFGNQIPSPLGPEIPFAL